MFSNISDERYSRLVAAGFVFNPDEQKWLDKYKLLVDNLNCIKSGEPLKHTGQQFQSWRNAQRHLFEKDDLNEIQQKRKELLDRVGYVPVKRTTHTLTLVDQLIAMQQW